MKNKIKKIGFRNREIFIREALPLIGHFNELESQTPIYGGEK